MECFAVHCYWLVLFRDEAKVDNIYLSREIVCIQVVAYLIFHKIIILSKASFSEITVFSLVYNAT